MRFYYADGSVFEGTWEDAPAWTVQFIAFDDGTPTPALRHQGSYYRLEDGEPVAMDHDDLIQWLAEEMKLIKVGYMVGTKRWKDLLAQADRDRVG